MFTRKFIYCRIFGHVFLFFLEVHVGSLSPWPLWSSRSYYFLFFLFFLFLLSHFSSPFAEDYPPGSIKERHDKERARERRRKDWRKLRDGKEGKKGRKDSSKGRRGKGGKGVLNAGRSTDREGRRNRRLAEEEEDDGRASRDGDGRGDALEHEEEEEAPAEDDRRLAVLEGVLAVVGSHQGVAGRGLSYKGEREQPLGRLVGLERHSWAIG